MGLLTHPYTLSTAGNDFKDDSLGLQFLKNKDLGRYLVSVVNESGGSMVRFITQVAIMSQAGARLSGGAQLCITEKRIVGFVVEGQGTTGTRSEDKGQMEGFSVDLAQIKNATAMKSWRKKINSVGLTGSDSSPFAIAITQVMGRVSNAGVGKPSNFDEVLSRLKTVGVTIEEG